MNSDPDAVEGAVRDARPLSARDRAAVKALADAGRLVNRLVADESLGDLMQAQGYSASELRTGVTLQTAAEEVFQTCQRALAVADRVQAALTSQWETAREDYLEFRWVVRSEFADDSARRVLSVHEPLSTDFQTFLAQAAVSYRAAQLVQPAEPLVRGGFGPERLTAALADLRRLARLDLALHVSRGRAARYLDERELALAMLNLWIRDFYRAARAALGERWRPPGALPMWRARRLRQAPPVHSGTQPCDCAAWAKRIRPARF